MLIKVCLVPNLAWLPGRRAKNQHNLIPTTDEEKNAPNMQWRQTHLCCRRKRSSVHTNAVEWFSGNVVDISRWCRGSHGGSGTHGGWHDEEVGYPSEICACFVFVASLLGEYIRCFSRLRQCSSPKSISILGHEFVWKVLIHEDLYSFEHLTMPF